MRSKNNAHGCGWWVGRILVGFVVLVAVIVLAGCVYQALGEANAARMYPPPGQLVDLGGYNLHLYCTGEGSPTVLLDAAFPGQVSNWVWVQPQIAQVTRVCSYDRAGLGWSDLGPEPRDALQHARELKTLLEKGSVPGPFVLVGHSLGALSVREFAELYPDQVAGMVLIEGSHPDVWQRQNMSEGVGVDASMLNVAPLLARFAFFRTGLYSAPPADPDLPPQQRAEAQAYFDSVKYFETLRRVNDAFPQALAQVRATKGIGDKPLAIVVGTGSDNLNGVALELQQDLLNLSGDSVWVEVEGATHSSLVDKEQHADDTAQAILDIVQKVRRQ
jgi:pimeloyl-ACP methyl ester carboxylesterase